MNTQVLIRTTGNAILGLLTAVALLASFQTNLKTRAHQSDRPFRGRSLAATQAPAAEPELFNLSDNGESLMAIQKIKSVLAAGKPFRVDIAENGTRFTPDETPAFADGLPAYGAEFVTEGYIYPGGTLSGPNGANPDGTPQFPNLVIGHWVCRGWHVGDGAHTVAGPWVITHQLFSFGTPPGAQTIATDGYETPEVGVPIMRAITGGSGMFSDVRGEASQVFFGFNASNGTSSRHEIRPK